MKAARLVVALVLLAPSLAAAQFPTTVQPGARVLVWLPDAYRQHDGPWHRQLLRGNVESVAGDTLRLTVPGATGSLVIARPEIRHLDLSLGVSRGASLAERAVEGAFSGAITTVLINETWPGGRYYHRTWRAAGAGAQWGAIVGGVLGFVFPSERWRSVRLGHSH